MQKYILTKKNIRHVWKKVYGFFTDSKDKRWTLYKADSHISINKEYPPNEKLIGKSPIHTDINIGSIIYFIDNKIIVRRNCNKPNDEIKLSQYADVYEKRTHVHYKTMKIGEEKPT